jgi:small subunit ribosomal protein S9
VINDRTFEDVFPRNTHRYQVLQPQTVTETTDKFHVQAKVAGGGVSSWAGAISHGIARALVAFDEGYRSPLRKNGLLTRDAREKERKKYGLKRARKAPQYTKR